MAGRFGFDFHGEQLRLLHEQLDFGRALRNQNRGFYDLNRIVKETFADRVVADAYLSGMRESMVKLGKPPLDILSTSSVLDQQFTSSALRDALQIGNTVEIMNNAISGIRAAVDIGRPDYLGELLRPIHLEALFPNLGILFRSFSEALREKKEELLFDGDLGYAAHLLADRLDIEIDIQREADESQHLSELVNEYLDSDDFQDELFSTMSELSLIDNRIRILEEALAVHRERRYLLSIPALLPQVEGLLAQTLSLLSVITFHNGRPAHADEVGDPLTFIDTKGKTKIQYVRGIQDLAQQPQAAGDPLIGGVAGLITSGLATTRNSILHGNKPDYDDGALSNKLLLTIFVLVNSLDVSLGQIIDDQQ